MFLALIGFRKKGLARESPDPMARATWWPRRRDISGVAPFATQTCRKKVGCVATSLCVVRPSLNWATEERVRLNRLWLDFLALNEIWSRGAGFLPCWNLSRSSSTRPVSPPRGLVEFSSSMITSTRPACWLNCYAYTGTRPGWSMTAMRPLRRSRRDLWMWSSWILACREWTVMKSRAGCGGSQGAINSCSWH